MELKKVLYKMRYACDKYLAVGTANNSPKQTPVTQKYRNVRGWIFRTPNP